MGIELVSSAHKEKDLIFTAEYHECEKFLWEMQRQLIPPKFKNFVLHLSISHDKSLIRIPRLKGDCSPQDLSL